MELSLIRSLMEKQFYEEHRGSRCPMKLFSKDIQKVKRVIDKAMDDYEDKVDPRKGGKLTSDGHPGKDGTSALGMAFTGDVHVHPGGQIIGGGGGGGGGGTTTQQSAAVAAGRAGKPNF